MEGREPDFIDLFLDKEVRINPLFIALEGNNRSTPNPKDIHEQWNEAHAQLQSALPKAKVIGCEPKFLFGALGLLQGGAAEFSREQRFLNQIAPGLVSPVATRLQNEKWRNVLAIADSHGIRRSSLLLVAVLSIILMPNGTSPAKRLLKVRSTHSLADAYNALADLRSLYLLMHLIALYPKDRVMLCTTDRDLALFWAGLAASKFGRVGNFMHFDLSASNLLPNATDEQRAALTRV